MVNDPRLEKAAICLNWSSSVFRSREATVGSTNIPNIRYARSTNRKSLTGGQQATAIHLAGNNRKVAWRSPATARRLGRRHGFHESVVETTVLSAIRSSRCFASAAAGLRHSRRPLRSNGSATAGSLSQLRGTFLPLSRNFTTASVRECTCIFS